MVPAHTRASRPDLSLSHVSWLVPEQSIGRRGSEDLSAWYCHLILKLHANSGCDTTSRIFGKGKSKFFLVDEGVVDYWAAVDVFERSSATKVDIAEAGRTILRTGYSTTKDRREQLTLNKMRAARYSDKSLAAATLHSSYCRVSSSYLWCPRSTFSTCISPGPTMAGEWTWPYSLWILFNKRDVYAIGDFESSSPWFPVRWNILQK